MDKTVLALRNIAENEKITQRDLAEKCGISLGSANKLIRTAEENGQIRKTDAGHKLTSAGEAFLKPYRVEKAVIMAAGFGSRFVPLTLETPKGLLEVLGEPMIERQIRQLHEAEITDITVIVGYMKERFEYLIDKFGVKLRYNPEFTDKNTLASLYHAADVLEGANAYILSSDNWMRENLYHKYEPCAWYAAAHAEGPTSEWVLETDKAGRITDTYPGGSDCDYMYGPAYFSADFSAEFLPALRAYYRIPGTENYYWEHVLMEILSGRAAKRFPGGLPETGRKPEGKNLGMFINRQGPDIIYEFENLEELRQFDPKYQNDSGSEAMQLVSRVFDTPESEITKIRCLKAGMTNNYWLFELKGKSYICRIPGEGTGRLINRQQEASVYEAVRPLNITEELVWLDPDTGYKISRFYENSRNASAKKPEEMRQCMQLLRSMHESGVTVAHSFDIAERIRYYESLILEESGFPKEAEALRSISADKKDTDGKNTSGKGLQTVSAENGEEILTALAASVPYSDYLEIRRRKDEMVRKLAAKKRPKCLCHIDSVPDNFIFVGSEEEKEQGSTSCGKDASGEVLKLIDWEYAGMADPLIDIAMCAIYSFMDETELQQLEGLYFGRKATEEEQDTVYAYVALGGLLWSLWGIYKEKLGVQFTDYTLKMYRYFKEYSAKTGNF